MRNILIVEDDKNIAELIKLHLDEHAFNVRLAFDGIIGLAEAESKQYDLVILDVMLPGMDGLEICRRIRAKTNHTRILMVTSKSTELDRVLGLEMGADDYLTKPFSIMEMVARVKSIFRRMDSLAENASGSEQKVIQIGALSIDPLRRTVILNGNEAELTSKEFDLLLYFAQHPGLVFTRTQLLDQVWGYSHSGYEHTVNSHINRLRAKIETDQDKPEYIQTVWGVGYKFTEDQRIK